MNGCEFCGLQESDLWIQIEDAKRLFCTSSHGLKFKNVLKAIKFKAGWSTVEMLIAKKTANSWEAKAFRGMAELEFSVQFDQNSVIIDFTPVYDD